jgi:hypothetical protein
MSISSMHTRISQQDSSQLLPSNLPIDDLILLTREMALSLDGGLDQPERFELIAFLADYLGLLVRMQSAPNYSRFLAEIDTQVPALMTILDIIIRDEIVSRLIGYPVQRLTVAGAISWHFETTNSLTEASNTEDKHA